MVRGYVEYGGVKYLHMQGCLNCMFYANEGKHGDPDLKTQLHKIDILVTTDWKL